jgi:hypothetical protein
MNNEKREIVERPLSLTSRFNSPSAKGFKVNERIMTRKDNEREKIIIRCLTDSLKTIVDIENMFFIISP